MHVDIKHTTWIRYYIHDKNKEEIIENLENKNLPWDFSESYTSEMLFDVEEIIDVNKNEGFSTIEVWDDEDDIIWQNGK